MKEEKKRVMTGERKLARREKIPLTCGEERERRKENGEPTTTTQGEIPSPLVDSKNHQFFISFKN